MTYKVAGEEDRISRCKWNCFLIKIDCLGILCKPFWYIDATNKEISTCRNVYMFSFPFLILMYYLLSKNYLVLRNKFILYPYEKVTFPSDALKSFSLYWFWSNQETAEDEKMISNNNPTLFLRLGYFMDDS